MCTHEERYLATYRPMELPAYIVVCVRTVAFVCVPLYICVCVCMHVFLHMHTYHAMHTYRYMYKYLEALLT